MTSEAPLTATGAIRVAAAKERTLGGIYGLSAYLLWGFLPVYFLALTPTGPWELVGWRVVLALGFCLFLLTITRRWGMFRLIIRQKRLLLLTGLAAAFIYVNWQVYVVAALTGHLLETSLGYFTNPIVTVLLGVVVLRERLRITQWVALGLAAVAVGVIIVAYGTFPWIALTLAFTFGLYGLVKKQIGPAVDAVSGLTLETAWIMPAAILQLVLVSISGGLTFGNVSGLHTTMMLFAGVITAIPLLFFAAGARRVPLTVMGMMQFIAPIVQFVYGAWILGEEMTLERWIGFALVWLALVVLTVDSLTYARRSRRTADAASFPVVVDD